MSVTFARVVVNLSLDRPFDYVIPERIEQLSAELTAAADSIS